MKTSWYRGLAALVLGSLAVVAAPAAIPGTVGAGDLVWWDANTNGIQDVGEPGFPLVHVTLYRLGVAVTTMPTDLDGAYFFEDQPTGTYQVGFTLPAGYLFSPRDQGGNDAGDSDPNPATGRTDPVALTPNQYTSDWDAGMYGPPVGVGNVVFIDRNGNQRFDEGEGAGGVRVEAYRDLGLAAGTLDGGDEFVGSVTTAPSGVYLFYRLAPGPYLVRIPPSEFAPGRPLHGLRSLPGQGGDSGADDDQDENGSDEALPAVHGCTSVRIMLYPGEEPVDASTETGKDAASDNANDASTDLTVDFGFAVPACDLVIDTFNDPELTTLQAGPFPFSDPLGLEAARSAALGGFRDMFVDSVLTGRTVELAFTDTLSFAEPVGGAGEYYITYDGQDGDPSPDAVEAVTGLGGLDFRGRQFQIDYLYSDVLLGRSVFLTLRVYSSPTDYSESLATVVSNTPFNSVVVFPPPTLASGGGANLGAVTALRLHFRTTGMAVDGEFDRFVAACLPSDFGDLPDALVPGAPDYATRWADGGPYHILSPGLHLGALTDGESDGWPSALADGDDLDPAGGPDDEDALAALPVFMRGSVATLSVAVNNPPGGPGGATLHAFADLNGDGDFADAGETQTAAVPDGTVSNVPVAFAVPANAPTGAPVGVRLRLSTTAGLGAGGYAPDGEVEDYLVRIVHPAAIGDRVWFDVNRDGVQNPGEPGMSGVIVTLYDGSTNVTGVTTTGVDGAYAFTNLVPGAYAVGFDLGLLSPFLHLTGPDLGGDDALDSDADPFTGRTIVTTLDSGETDPTWDAGVICSGIELVCPPDRVLECPADTGTGATGRATASSPCGCPPSVIYTDALVTVSACTQILARTWTATDGCGNTTSCTQHILVQDTTAPRLVGVPTDLVVACEAPPPPNVTAEDACGTNPVVVLEVVTNGACPKIITRTWMAADACGNAVTGRQTVTVEDTTPPVLVCPSYLVLPGGSDCTATLPAPPAAVDNCDGTNVLVTQTPPAGTVLSGAGTTHVTVVAVDGCNNAATCTYEAVVSCVAGYQVVKTRTAPAAGPAVFGESVEFQITVTNTGTVQLVTVPVEDTYQTNHLFYSNSTPPTVDNDNDGMLNWTNVGPLTPGAATSLIVRFASRLRTVAGALAVDRTNVVVVSAQTPTNAPSVYPQTGAAPYRVAYGSIGDTVWVDQNGNGNIDENLATSGLNGVTVQLQRVSGGATSTVGLAVTASNATQAGYYLFTNLPAGAYLASVVGGVPPEYPRNTRPGIPPYYAITLGANGEFLDADFGYVSKSNTLVDLLYFHGRQEGRSARLEWATAAEWNNLGFHLYRASAADGPRTRLTDALIAGAGTGQTYAWTDDGLPEDGALYWLEDLDVDGTRTLHGPVRIGTPAGAGTAGFVTPAGTVCRIDPAAMRAAGLNVAGVEGSLLEVRVGGTPVAAYCSAQGRPMTEQDYVLFYAGGAAGSPQVVTVGLREGALRMETVYAGPLYEALPGLAATADATGLTPLTLAGTESLVAVRGLGEADAWILDVTDPASPRLLLGAELMLQAEGVGLFFSPAEWRPASCLVVEPRAMTNLRAPAAP